MPQISPQDIKGKSTRSVVFDDEVKKYPSTIDKYVISIVIEQGRILSKFEYKMTSYDPRTFRAFFEPAKTTKPIRLYTSNSKRQRPQIISITLLEYNHGRITAEEQISLQPLSFSVNEPGAFKLFRDRLSWHMFVQVSMEDHSQEFDRKKDPHRWFLPLGFEVDVVVDDDFVKESSSNVVVDGSYETEKKEASSNVVVDGSYETEKNLAFNEDNDSITPPPVVRSNSSFPFHNRVTTEWSVNKPGGWRRKLKKLGCNIRHVFFNRF